MTLYYPQVLAIVQDIPSRDLYLEQPPVAWQTVAEGWNSESGTSFDGRYIRSRGELNGGAVIKRQDTFLTGTNNLSGRDFTIIQGVWYDSWVDPQYDVHGLLMSDSTPDVAFEIISTTTTPAIEYAEIILWRGLPPAASTTAHTKQNNNCYIHLAYFNPNGDDYRIALEYGNPISLDYFWPVDNQWHRVAVCRDLGNLEKLIIDYGERLRFLVNPTLPDGTIDIEVGEGNWLHHCPKNFITNVRYQADPTTWIPYPGNIRVVGQNGWVGLEYFPIRYQPLNTTKSVVDFGFQQPNAANAYGIPNALSREPAGQTDIISVNTPDGQQFSWQAQNFLPDAGDGLGSANPARFSDVNILIPSSWINYIPGGTIFPATTLRSMRVHEMSILDDASRTATTSAILTVNNFDSIYTGAYGNVALTLLASNQPDFSNAVVRITGIAGTGNKGIEFCRQDPMRLMGLPCYDSSYKMQIPLGQEVEFDGWCLFSAVRFLGELGNINPMYMLNIPEWPYGPADASCPYPILPRGTGLNPKYKFLPDISVWAVLSMLVMDSGYIDPLSGNNIPYYTGFDNLGNFIFAPYTPYSNPVKMIYSDSDGTGLGQIEEFYVYNSVAQMRSEINFQGIDAYSYELLQYHLDMPPVVKSAIGYRYPWLERNARYASQAYLQQLANSAASQASIPEQVIRMKVPFQPGVFAGDTIVVQEAQSLNRTEFFYITELESFYGLMDVSSRSGIKENYSWITARALVNYL